MRDPLVEQSFTYRQMLTLALVLMIGAVLVPTGVDAAASLFRLQDADSTVLAQVDQGKVRVGDGSGDLTVNGNVGITPAQSAVQIGAREPVHFYQEVDLAQGFPGKTEDIATVPQGKRLIIETIGVIGRVPPNLSQRPTATLWIQGEGFYPIPLEFGTTYAGTEKWNGTVDVDLWVNPGQTISGGVERNNTTGTAIVQFSVAGHYVPA